MPPLGATPGSPAFSLPTGAEQQGRQNDAGGAWGRAFIHIALLCPTLVGSAEYWFPIPGGDTEFQRGEVTCPRFHSCVGAVYLPEIWGQAGLCRVHTHPPASFLPRPSLSPEDVPACLSPPTASLLAGPVPQCLLQTSLSP